MLTTSFDSYPEVMRIPYPPVFKDREHNCGFVDLRDRPDFAAKIGNGVRLDIVRRLS